MFTHPPALDTQTLATTLAIGSGLLMVLMVRITFLLRTHNRLREQTGRMEKQVLIQQQEILAVRQDSNTWRGELQRMSDAFRSEYANRMAESEQRYEDIQKRREGVPTPQSPSGQEGDTAVATAPTVTADKTEVPPVPDIAGPES